MEKKKTIRPFRSLAGEYINGKIFLYSCDYEMICEYDLSKNAIKIICGRKLRNKPGKALYINSILHKSSIYFMPFGEGNIIKFSTDTYELEEIPFTKEKQYKSISPIIYNNKLYLFPEGYSEKIYYIQIESGKMGYIANSSWEKIQLKDELKSDSLFCGCILIDQYVYRACRFAPLIQKYDLKKNCVTFYELKGVKGRFRDLTYDGSCFWIILYDSARVIQWDEKSSTILKDVNLAEVSEVPELRLASVSSFYGNIYFQSLYTAHIIWLEQGKTEKCFTKCCEDFPEFCFNGVESQAFANTVKTDLNGNIFFIPYRANGIVILGPNHSSSFLKLQIQCNDILDILGEDNDFNEAMCSLSEFFNLISNQREKNMEDINKGDQIWKYLGKEK